MARQLTISDSGTRVLITESARDFRARHEQLKCELKPQGIAEHDYVEDIASHRWEIERLRRCKVVILNTAFRPALKDLLMKLLREPGQFDHGAENEADALALAWFTDEEARKKVGQILKRFNLDESAIEAEAMRSCFCELDTLDRLIASAESRYTKALRCLMEFRAMAPQFRENASRMIDAKPVQRLEHASGKKSAAA